MLLNKNILVTGVGKGLGFNLLHNIISNNGYVYGITRSKEDLKKFKNVKNCKVFLGDVKNTNIIKKIIIQSKKDKRVINGLVNNAAERQRIKFTNINKKKLMNLFEVNFFSVFENMKTYSNYLKVKKTKGSIVNIGSIVGERGFSDLVGYGSSKSALTGFSKCLAIELANKNYKCRVNIVNPGFVKTSYYKKFKKNKKLYKWTVQNTPISRWASSEEISNLVIFLISDKSSYINGQKINIDGGWTAK